jgi:hypothetical protein
MKTAWVEPGDGDDVGDILCWIGAKGDSDLDLNDVRRTALAILLPGPPANHDRVRAVEALSRMGVAVDEFGVPKS